MDGNAASTNAAILADAVTRSNEAYLAYAFLSGANRKKYENFSRTWQTHMLMTRMNIPRHLLEHTNYLLH
eukprot:4665888-Ditylum_brightwellii.AAC.1